MDEVHVVGVCGVNTVNRTNIDTACVLHIDTGFRDHVGHLRSESPVLELRSLAETLSLSSQIVTDIAEFPLPADVSEEERATAKGEIGRYAEIVGDEPRVIRFKGRTIGQTGPVWHLQYTRMYALENAYLVAAHDLHEGIKVAHADSPEKLPLAFENETVREFLEDELRFRKIVVDKPKPAGR